MTLKGLFSKLKFKQFPSYQLSYLILIMMFIHLIGFRYDHDFWFTINQGRYVLEHGFPTTTIFSMHSFNFVYQSWGAGTLFYLIYHYFDLYGIMFLIFAVSALTMYFFYKLCFTVSDNKRGSLFITIIALVLYSFYIVTRPHIFTVLNLVIMLYLLESYIKSNNIKYLYWLPFISLFQINIHGIYFILLLIILTPYLINSFKFNIFHIESSGYRKKPLFIAFLCMLLTGFLNPYGYKTIIYGFSSYQSNSLFNNTIIELKALDFHTFPSKIFIIIIIGTFILHFTKLKEKPLRYTLLLLGTSYLAFDALKSFYLFLFCSFFPLSTIFKKNDQIDNSYSSKYHYFHLGLTIVICICFVLMIKKPDNPDIKEFMDYLDNNVTDKENIKLFTNYVDGSYAEYRGYVCYLDPRGEVFTKAYNKIEDIYQEFDDVEKFKINYKEFEDKYKFDYMLVEKDSALGYLMKNDSYKYTNVKEDELHILYKLDKEKKYEKN